MIVREQPDGRILIVNQTSHALMAAAFCRHWGNREFARPEPYDAVLAAIAQHDNGWYEWEEQPRLRADGYPMDFLHDDDPLAKVALWARGAARAAAQHPYAGLLVGQHAVSLYVEYPTPGLPAAVQRRIDGFVANQRQQIDDLRRAWQATEVAAGWLDEARITANTRLLRFGDSASLQVCIPWSQDRVISQVPVDGTGTFTKVRMTFDDATIAFDPWPYAVDSFEVDIWGRLLGERTFPNESAYHAALAVASWARLSWRVVNGQT